MCFWKWRWPLPNDTYTGMSQKVLIYIYTVSLIKNWLINSICIHMHFQASPVWLKGPAFFVSNNFPNGPRYPNLRRQLVVPTDPNLRIQAIQRHQIDETKSKLPRNSVGKPVTNMQVFGVNKNQACSKVDHELLSTFKSGNQLFFFTITLLWNQNLQVLFEVYDMVLSGKWYGPLWKRSLKLVLSSIMVSPKKHTHPRTVFSFTQHNKLHTFPDRKDGLGDKAFLFVWKGDLFRGCCYLQLMLFCLKYGL